MKIGGLLLLHAVSGSSLGEIPSLTAVAEAIVSAGFHADYHQLWRDLRGDALTASAVGTRNRNQMQSAMLLGGTVIGMGVPLPVERNGLRELCDMFLSTSVLDEFFAKPVFDERWDKLDTAKGLYVSQSGIDAKAMVLFPLSNMHYVCGTELPLVVKLAIFRSRVARAAITPIRDPYRIDVIHSIPETLETSFKQLLNIFERRSPERGELGLKFAVSYRVEDLRGHEAVLHWLTVTFSLLFKSEYFHQEPNGEYNLVLEGDDRPKYGYFQIGQLLGLALMKNFAIGVRLEKYLLRALLSDAPSDLSFHQPIELRRLRSGFYQVTTMEALFGSFGNPRKLFNEIELSELLTGRV